jgi:hypothetical protein
MNEKPLKNFTSPLSLASRFTFLSLTNLSEVEVDIFEICEKWVLGASRFRGVKKSLLSLSPTDVSDLADIKSSPSRPTFVFNHLDGLARTSCFPQLSLWDELLPPQWVRFATVFRKETGYVAEVFPIEFANKLKDLWDAFNRFDAFLSGHELTHLEVQAGEYSLPLVFHYLNGRRLEVGVSHGTQVTSSSSSMTLSLRFKPEETDPIANLSQCLNHLVEISQAESISNLVDSSSRRVVKFFQA